MGKSITPYQRCNHLDFGCHDRHKLLSKRSTLRSWSTRLRSWLNDPSLSTFGNSKPMSLDFAFSCQEQYVCGHCSLVRLISGRASRCRSEVLGSSFSLLSVASVGRVKQRVTKYVAESRARRLASVSGARTVHRLATLFPLPLA